MLVCMWYHGVCLTVIYYLRGTRCVTVIYFLGGSVRQAIWNKEKIDWSRWGCQHLIISRQCPCCGHIHFAEARNVPCNVLSDVQVSSQQRSQYCYRWWGIGYATDRTTSKTDRILLSFQYANYDISAHVLLVPTGCTSNVYYIILYLYVHIWYTARTSVATVAISVYYSRILLLRKQKHNLFSPARLRDGSGKMETSELKDNEIIISPVWYWR